MHKFKLNLIKSSILLIVLTYYFLSLNYFLLIAYFFFGDNGFFLTLLYLFLNFIIKTSIYIVFISKLYASINKGKKDLDFHYNRLGLDRSSSKRDIRNVVKDKAREFHPDLTTNLIEKEKRTKFMQEINESAEILKSQIK